VEVVEHRPLVGLAELRRARLPVAPLAVGSIGSRRRSFGSLHTQRRDLDRRSTERIALRNPSGCWRQVDRESLGRPQREIARLHNHRIHYRHSSLDDRLHLADNLGRSHAAGVGYL